MKTRVCAKCGGWAHIGACDLCNGMGSASHQSPPVYLGARNTGEADPSVMPDQAGGDALTGAALARWCYENPNLAAMTIEGLRHPVSENTHD